MIFNPVNYLTSSLEAQQQTTQTINRPPDLEYWASLNDWLNDVGLMQTDGGAPVYRQQAY